MKPRLLVSKNPSEQDSLKRMQNAVGVHTLMRVYVRVRLYARVFP